MREVQLGVETFSRGDPVPLWVQRHEIPATTLRNPVVTRLADTQFRLGDVHEVYIERAVQVNDSAALARIGQYPIQFVPQYQKVRLHGVEILRGNERLERTSNVNVRFLQREVGLESGVYSGAVTAALLIEDVRVGDTLHISFSIEGANPVYGPRFSDAASWDAGEPTEIRRVSLIHPQARNVRWRMIGDFNTRQPQPEESTQQGMRTLRFEERNLPGIDGEPYVPDSYVAWRYLQFSEYQDWQEVARWADTLFTANPALPEEAQALVQRLRNLPNDEERVLGALRWVQREIRYFSVSLGESSHRPHDIGWVMQRRYGDCKDKTYLLASLLRALDIDAQPMLVSLQARRLPAKLLPSPDGFDHAIVRVRLQDKSYYIDGTRLEQDSGTLDTIGLALNRAWALVVSPDTTALLELTSSRSVEQSTSELRELISIPRLDPQGLLEAHQTWRGSAAEHLRRSWSLWTPEQRRKVVLAWYERRYPGIEHATDPTATDDAPANAFTIHSSFTVPKLAQTVNGDWGVRFSPTLLQGVFNLPDSAKRNFPLDTLPYPFQARFSLVMQWPDSVSVVSDPTTQHVSGNAFKAEVTRRFRGARFEYQLEFSTSGSETSAKDMPRLLEDVRRLNNSIDGLVVVERKAIKESGLFGLGADTVQSNMRKRTEDIITRTSATINSAQVKGEDLVETLCTRAESLADLGRGSDGIADANEAVRIAPGSPRAAMCRGNLYFNVSDFQRAIPDYTRALTLGQTPGAVYYHRALARFYGEQMDRALDDFTQAAAADPRNIYPRLWQMWTLQRLGQAVPRDLMELARTDPRGAWPRPALALLAGAISVDDLLTLVQRMQGDERELNMTEALFYIGQWHLVQGRKDLARTSFEATRAKGITMYIEHVAAGFELARLGK